MFYIGRMPLHWFATEWVSTVLGFGDGNQSWCSPLRKTDIHRSPYVVWDLFGGFHCVFRETLHQNVLNTIGYTLWICSFIFGKPMITVSGNWLQGACNRVYPKKYAHSFCFAVLCCGYTLTDFPISIRLTSLALWQSNDCPSASKASLMNMDKYFMWIHYERLHNHNKAKHNKTVCIFLGIYCRPIKWRWRMHSLYFKTPSIKIPYIQWVYTG